jgi:hypothetical protein
MVFMGLQTKMSCFQSQGCVIGNHRGWGVVGLTKCRADDSVIRFVGIESMFVE